jgi:acyltransferase
MSTAARTPWIDNAKAIGMILVVWGHTSGIDAYSTRFISCFHMPLFFFLAGTLVKQQRLETSLPNCLKTYFRGLIVPYLVFGLLSYLVWLPRQRLLDSANGGVYATVIAPLLGLLYGVGDSLDVNIVLWFFTCLFFTVTLFWCLHKTRHGVLMALLVVTLGGLGPLVPEVFGFQLPWGLDVAMVAVPFFGLGYLCQRALGNQLPTGRTVSLLAAAALTLILALNCQRNSSVEMHCMKLGHVGWFYFNALIGILLTVLVASCLPRSSWSSWIARNTIVIFPLHLIIFGFLTAAAVFGLGLDRSFKDGSLFWSLIYTATAIAVCVPLAWMIRRFCPWALGYR